MGDLNLDPEIFRRLLLRLEADERSPPEPIFITIAKMAGDICCSAAEIQLQLDFINRSRLIDGPGVHGEGAFLFRKLTTQGRLLARANLDVEAFTSGLVFEGETRSVIRVSAAFGEAFGWGCRLERFSLKLLRGLGFSRLAVIGLIEPTLARITQTNGSPPLAMS